MSSPGASDFTVYVQFEYTNELVTITLSPTDSFGTLKAIISGASEVGFSQILHEGREVAPPESHPLDSFLHNESSLYVVCSGNHEPSEVQPPSHDVNSSPQFECNGHLTEEEALQIALEEGNNCHFGLSPSSTATTSAAASPSEDADLALAMLLSKEESEMRQGGVLAFPGRSDNRSEATSQHEREEANDANPPANPPHVQRLPLGIQKEDYLDPKSKNVMADPVTCDDGYSYDRKTLEQHWDSTDVKTSPMTGDVVSDRIVPNRRLEDQIVRLVEDSRNWLGMSFKDIEDWHVRRAQKLRDDRARRDSKRRAEEPSRQEPNTRNNETAVPREPVFPHQQAQPREQTYPPEQPSPRQHILHEADTLQTTARFRLERRDRRQNTDAVTDTCLSTTLCTPADCVTPEFLRGDNGYIPCMMVCCGSNLGAQENHYRWCGRCGRLACDDCLRSGVTDISSNSNDALVPICIECTVQIADAMKSTSSAENIATKRAVVVLERVVIGSWLEEAKKRAHRAKTVIVSSNNEHQTPNRLASVCDAIKTLKEQWDQHRKEIRDYQTQEEVSNSTSSIDHNAILALEQKYNEKEKELTDLLVVAELTAHDDNQVVDILARVSEITVERDMHAEELTLARSASIAKSQGAPLVERFVTLNSLGSQRHERTGIRRLWESGSHREARRAYETLKSKITGLAAVMDRNLPTQSIQLATSLVETLRRLLADGDSSIDRAAVSGAIVELEDFLAVLQCDRLEEKHQQYAMQIDQCLRDGDRGVDRTAVQESQAYIECIGQRSSWPLPFNLELPTERLEREAQELKASIDREIETLKNRKADTLTSSVKELCEHRDALANSTACLQREAERARERARLAETARRERQEAELRRISEETQERRRVEEEQSRMEEERRQEEARRLREDEDQKMAARLQAEGDEMQSSVCGRAYLFVGEMQSLLVQLRTINGVSDLRLDTVTIDDMVAFTEAFITCQEQFRSERRPSEVLVGYHYTKPQSMNNIRTGGLMSGPERSANNVTNFQRSGSVYGEGIYTANNPDAFQNYGSVGLILAVVKGNQKYVTGSEAANPRVNTVVGNKSLRSANSRAPHFSDEIVLRQSAQCIPLFSFARTSSPGNDTNTIWRCHEELQKVLDTFFNGGRSVAVRRVTA